MSRRAPGEAPPVAQRAAALAASYPGAAAGRHGPRRSAVRAGAVVALTVALLVLLFAPWEGSASPTFTVRASLSSLVVAPGVSRPLPWPPTGQAAVAIPALSVAAASGPARPVPVASLTKIMTAYVVLRDHPLPAAAAGPSLVMGQADVADFEQDTVTDQASAQVAAGEVLTERQLLTGMLVHSADNLADTLARWDAGSIPAFVARMNEAAAALGMRQSHFADTSGFSPGSVSTATDILKVAAAAMRFPAFDRIVEMPAVTLPVAGDLVSYTPLLGVPGVVGVKSGFTSAAGGADVLAWRERVAGRPVTVLAAVTGQEGPDVLLRAGLLDLAIARAAAAELEPVVAVEGGRQVATVIGGGRRVPVTVGRPISVLAWPTEAVHRVLGLRRRPVAGSRTDTCLGTLTVTVGAERAGEPACTAGRLPGRRPAHGLM
ncbi:MAG: D-alanyl-D-alanine carboxypeptidase family protein [Acidimicrobiales bacterium]